MNDALVHASKKVDHVIIVQIVSGVSIEFEWVISKRVNCWGEWVD